MTESIAGPSVLGPFWGYLADYKKLLAAIIALGAAPALLDFIFAIGPPWPHRRGVILLTGLVAWVVLLWSFSAWRLGTQRVLGSRLSVCAIVTAASLMAYILLHAFFVDDAPDSRHQEAAGFIVRPEIQKVLDQEPETTIRDLWKGAEYDPTAVWVPWTVYSVRSVLIFSWFGLFGGLSFVASAFLLLQEKLRVGRGVQPWGDRASAGLSDRGKARQSTVVTTTTPSAPAEPVHGPPRDILGRGQIGLENLKDEETPSLKTAPGVDAGTLFMAVSSPRPSQSTAKTPRGNDVPSRVTPLEIFFCYASRDQRLRNQLETHLSNLKRQNLIAGWHDRKIAPGMEWKGQLDEHLESARIILLLVSADFLASDYCFEVEMRRALERHNAGDARVIPIILRPCDWLTAPFGKLQALPTDLKPITKWSNRDNAFQDVAAGIRKVVEELAQNP